MSLRTYLDAAWKDGKAPFDPSTLVITLNGLFDIQPLSRLKKSADMQRGLELNSACDIIFYWL